MATVQMVVQGMQERSRLRKNGRAQKVHHGGHP